MKNNIYIKKSMKERTKGIIGILLVMLALAGIFFWESYGREAFTYTQVLVMQGNVERGTVITLDMLGTIKTDRGSLIDEEDRVIKPKEIIGKQASTYIPKGMQLSKRFFMKQGVVAKKGEYVMAIPKEWIFTFPQSIRRGDTMYFYPVKNIEDYAVDENGVVLPNAPPAGRPALKAKIAYVKDSGNREVIDVTPDRIDASAVIATIEIIVDDKRCLEIRSLAEDGNKFIMSYE